MDKRMKKILQHLLYNINLYVAFFCLFMAVVAYSYKGFYYAFWINITLIIINLGVWIWYLKVREEELYLLLIQMGCDI